MQEWVSKALNQRAIHLSPNEWFDKGHGIVGGTKDHHGIWIPDHAKNGRVYLWMPPPVIAEVALEECTKAVHKQTDAFHIFMIPRLFSPSWMRMFFKLVDFCFVIPIGSHFCPCEMHEPLFVGISLPFIRCRPWSLQRTPLLVELEGRLREVFESGNGDGRDILCKLLQIPGWVAAMLDDMACKMLQVSWSWVIPIVPAQGCGREPMVQAEAKGG